MPGVNQVNVNEKAGLTVATALRSFLRQDPDVIMIGEIRDLETAQIAIQASLTGHLVLATLHTNDAPSAVTRLLDMGVESFLLSSSLVGVMAQRLVRQTCKACAGAGCAACDATGFKGRLGIFEMLVMDDALRTAVKDRQDASEIRRLAASQGFRSLREDGERLVSLGLTTAAEVARVTELGDLE
jgi:general secretion pathway protein E